MVAGGAAAQLTNVWVNSGFPWEASALILTFIAFSVSALAYMLSRVFISKDLEKWAKIEFMYALSSVILVAFLIFLVDFMAVKATEFGVLLSADRDYLSSQVAADQSPFAIANFYITTMANCVRARYIDMFALSFVPKLLLSLEITTKSFTFVIPGFVGGILMQLLNTVLSATYTLTYLLYTLDFQRHLLVFARETMLTIFLPVGIVLRAFPFTRSSGNLFIAIAIGFYFVYPTAYGMVLAISKPVSLIEGSCGIHGFKDVTSYFDSSSWVNDATGGAFSLKTMSFATLGLSSVFSMMFGAATYVTHLGLLLANLGSVLSELMLYVMFYPIVVIIVTYTFIKGFSTFLGVEAQDFAQGLVRLV
ncbi:Uncharacterised protein [uncultured archaeon]|nr:Uncharacterised protein [uncultured archaeon]